MELREAIQERKSIRKFRSEPVAKTILEEILQAALRAPSAINTQPWECWLAGGEALKQMSREMYAEAEKEMPSRSDVKLQESWPEANMNRMRENGKGLFGILGIDRHDQEKRKA
ncbi:MAG: nitroreductase family protein, partial [Deltaproteobacteria bacterium]|nr:nitroreductase family protein [Deltaproteobacteria bacterium]